jgi:hypothetical protein
MKICCKDFTCLKCAAALSVLAARKPDDCKGTRNGDLQILGDAIHEQIRIFRSKGTKSYAETLGVLEIVKSEIMRDCLEQHDET